MMIDSSRLSCTYRPFFWDQYQQYSASNDKLKPNYKTTTQLNSNKENVRIESYDGHTT